MEFSPYLKALQSIEGQTPGEKYRTLNNIARRIATEYIDVDREIQILPSDELPKELIPWVTVVVGDILKRPQEIAYALRSDDIKVFNRALKAKWYFISNVPRYSNVSFFVSRLFPKISLLNRLKIIRVLGNSLRPNPDLARKFYVPIAKQYGYDIAQPILMACNESSIWDAMLENRLVFNLGQMKYLYNKFPTLVIDYLKKSVREDYVGKPLHAIYIDKYKDFLPLILNKHPENFIDFIERSCTMGIRLSGEKTKLFLKVGIDAVVDDPEFFLPILNVKDVHQKLQFMHFRLMLKKLFPPDLADLDFEEIKEYLKYIPPEHRTSVITSTCYELYGLKWVENFQNISPTALRVLSDEHRIYLANKKLLSDQKWYTDNDGKDIAKSWRCYLPIAQSIPEMKDEFVRSESVLTKIIVMRLMDLTCDINKDSAALLSTLTYISTHFTYSTTEYSKEEEWQLMDLLSSSITQNSSLLQKDHWTTIYEYMRFMKQRQGSMNNEKTAKAVLIKGIEFDLMNNHSIKKKIKMLTELYHEKPWILNWNIHQNEPKYEKLCLEEFSKAILKVFSKHQKNNTYQWREVCLTFLKAIYDYNYRHYIKAKDIKRKLSIKKFPWLDESVQKLMNTIMTQHREKKGVRNNQIVDLAELDDLLRYNEPHLLPLGSVQAYTKTMKFFQQDRLQYIFNSQSPFCNYKNYYEVIKEKIARKCTRTFLRYCCWHQDVPIKLVELALEDFKKNKNREAIIVLSILTEGSEFERFIIPIISDSSTVTEELLKVTIQAIKHVNPMVTTGMIVSLCSSGIDRIMKDSVIVLTSRMKADRVIPICQTLMQRHVNIYKHSLDALRIAMRLDKIVPILREYWVNLKRNFDGSNIDDEDKRHQLIRTMLIVFETKACRRIWRLLDNCLDDLNTRDGPSTLRILTMFEDVPSEWMGEYLGKIITTIKRLERESGTEGHWAKWYETDPLLDYLSRDVALLIPDYAHEFVMSEYWNIRNTNRQLLAMAIRYSINSYILPVDPDDDLEERLDVLSTIFVYTIVNNWYVEEPRNELWNSTIQDFLDLFIEILIFNTNYSVNKNKLIDEMLSSFLTVLSPVDNPQFYCYFYFSSFYDSTTTSDGFIDKIHTVLPILYGYFTANYSDLIAGYLHRLMKYFYGDEVPDMIIHLLEKSDRVANCLASCLFIHERRYMNDSQFWQIYTRLQTSQDAFVTLRLGRALEARNRGE